MTELKVRREGATLLVDLADADGVEFAVTERLDGPWHAHPRGAREFPAPPRAAQLFVRARLADGRQLVAGERLLALDGAHNVRDLGGYPTADGRRVRWGRLYRGDNPGGLTDADVARLAGLGLRVIVDFRSDAELAEYGTRLTELPGVEVLRLPIVEELVERTTPMQRILARTLTSFSADDMAQLYHGMLDRNADVFGRLVLLAEGAQPGRVLFHCTGGKDRTGLAAALLLETLGVERSLVLEDYELTNTYRTERRVEALRPRFEAAGIDIVPLLALLGAPRPALAAALARLDEVHGGAEAYLKGPGGVPNEVIDRLRGQLLND